jgi:outer membrane protein assembly factor BamD
MLPGCATMKKISASLGFGGESEPAAVETLVENGMNDYNHGEYTAALKSFTEIKDRFPFSNSSLLAELKAADCQYYLGHTPEAVALYKDFESNHPTNEAVPYIMFQIGMSYYNQIDTVDRAPPPTPLPPSPGC